MSEQNIETPTPEFASVPQAGLLRRIGCVMLTILWFAILLLPCGCFLLATQGQIVIAHGEVPESEAHPLLKIELISEIDFRGLSIMTTSIHAIDENGICVQSNVRYLLWAGQGDSSTYCDCYVRDSIPEMWSFIETHQGACA